MTGDLPERCCNCGMPESSHAPPVGGLKACALPPSSPAIAPEPPPPPSATIDQGKSTGGAKADPGKPGTHLLPTRPLLAVARVLDFGAHKYAPDNWRKGIAYTRIYGAILRHLWAWWQGEQADPETGLHPLAHAACELLFLLEYESGPDVARRDACDDRPETGRAAKVTRA